MCLYKALNGYKLWLFILRTNINIILLFGVLKLFEHSSKFKHSDDTLSNPSISDFSLLSSSFLEK